MRIPTIICLVLSLGLITACSSPDSADEAPSEVMDESSESSVGLQERLVEERLRLIDQYRDCVEQAGTDPEQVEACDAFLNAAEALN